MMQRKNMVLIGLLVVGLCRAADGNALQLSQPALDFFNVWLGYYEGVIKEENLSTDTGLSGAFHGMFVDGAKNVSEDPSAQAVAALIYDKMEDDSTVKYLLDKLENHFGYCSRATSITNQIKVLAQKDGVLASSQMGFTLQVPEGDLDAVFGQDPNVALTKELFLRNADYPNTPEAIAVVRGNAIANCYLTEVLQEYIPDAKP